MLHKDFFEKFARTVVVVISPHPDDSVLGAGGLIHRLTDKVEWARHSDATEEDWPVVYTFVMTPGGRGVDDEYLRRYVLNRIKERDVGLAEYLMRKMSGADTDPEREAQLKAIREDIRQHESASEARILRVRQSFFLDLHGIYHEHMITAEDDRRFRETICPLLASHEGCHKLFLVPHRDDMHPVHKLSTEIVVNFIEQDLNWESTVVWQYESPWITLPPNQIDTVVLFDSIGMATKAEAMAVHRSQEYRTKYSDVARYRAQMKAETLPELLGGFGSTDMGWDYVEAFERLHPVAILGMPED